MIPKNIMERILKYRKGCLMDNQFPTEIPITKNELHEINIYLEEQWENVCEKRLTKPVVVLPEAPKVVQYGDFVYGMKIVESQED